MNKIDLISLVSVAGALSVSEQLERKGCPTSKNLTVKERKFKTAKKKKRTNMKKSRRRNRRK